MNERHAESLPVTANSSQKSLILQLSQMGFTLPRVVAAIDYTEAEDIDAVLDFLTKGDYGWRHPFLRSGYTANESGQNCVMCEEPLTEHQEYVFAKNEKLTRSLSSIQTLLSRCHSAPSQLLSEPKCPICLEEITDEWRLPACSAHYFCKECVRHYIAASVLEGRDVKCPGEKCQCVLSIEEIAEFVGENAASKYAGMREKAALAQDPTVKWCRTRDCPGYVRQSSAVSTAQCPICSVVMCTNCGEKEHQGLSCEAVVDKEIEVWTADKAVKRCPQCTRLIEKNEGCDHMTCIACRHEWCWLCLGPFTPAHFVEEAPDYCPVMAEYRVVHSVPLMLRPQQVPRMYRPQRVPRMYRPQRVLGMHRHIHIFSDCCSSPGCIILLVITLVLLFPVMLVIMMLVLPWVVAIKVPRKKLEGQCKQVLVGVLLWILVVAVDPLASIAALILLDIKIAVEIT